MEIKPIEQILTTDGVHVVQIKIYNPHEVRQMEVDYKGAIEALIPSVGIVEVMIESLNGEDKLNPFKNRLIKIVEKAYGEKWEDIRRKK